MPYLFLSDQEKTRWLLCEARRDDVFAPIVDDLEAFGFEITHSFWEGNGVYQPYLLTSSLHGLYPEGHKSMQSMDHPHKAGDDGGGAVGDDCFIKEFFKQHAQGKFKARFRLGFRHGAGAALFHFLHELVHFKQDLDGRILEPVADLEAQAAAESIAAAYRLKQAGYPKAWHGAMGSINWRGAAKATARGGEGESTLLNAARGAAQTPAAIWKKLKY